MAVARFTTTDSVIMLVDHQTGTLGWVKSLSQATVVTACRVLARLAIAYDMPLVLTTTMEAQVGPTIPTLLSLRQTPLRIVTRAGGSLTAGTRRTCATAFRQWVASRS